MRFGFAVAVACLIAVLADAGLTVLTRRAEAKSAAADPAASVAQLQARVNELEGRVANQAIVMTHIGYHFTNLWFAARQHNWPLADFYLGEVRDNLKWAVRVHPVRQGPAGEVNVAGIAEAVDGTELTKLSQAIHDKRSDAFVRAYDETLAACHSCHQAVGKPYLVPHRPVSPEVQLIDFAAATPSAR